MNDTPNQPNDSAAGHVPHYTTADFKQKIEAAGDKPVFVDFYAEWCGPCKMAAPIIDKLAVEYKDKAILAKLDTDADSEIAAEFGIMSIPTVIIFKNGDEIARKIGFPGEPGYRQMLDKAIAA